MFVARMRKILHIAMILLLGLPSASAMASTVAYSVNSDGGDILYQIDLESGTVIPLGVKLSGNSDIEGLAIDNDSNLWGVDEDKFTMFRLNPATGGKVNGTELPILGINSFNANDFGLTFSCDGTLYASSVTLQTLYTIDDAGIATIVGELHDLGVNISAIAAYGREPTRIFGLGNGLVSPDDSVEDNRTLYEIDPELGTATPIGTGIGGAVAAYHQAGLSFDASGKLWAITDRSALGLTSEIISIDVNSGIATVESDTGNVLMGFESLAAAPPTGCTKHVSIPALDGPGRFIAILVLMLTGLVGIRHRIS
jgi:hypothetical protein